MSSHASRFRRARERQKQRPPTLVAYDTEAFATAHAALLTACRVQGCTCTPDIAITTDGHATAQHDDWCPLLRRHDTN
jgi:hypothetical protein